MVAGTGKFAPGALVQTRGRTWVVTPSDDNNVLRLRPVDGSDESAIGLYLPLEEGEVRQSRYETPDSAKAGDFTGALLLRDAVRLALRSGAGPFRSLGRLSVIPRPYQYVPLIMSLRLDPVRLLIADDVGVGKTIEAAMIARELLDRGIARRLAVLCAPHLCEQWAQELSEKFNIEAAIVQPARIGRLERELPRRDLSIYQYYRHLVVSIDYIKSDRNRGPFLDNAPDLIIVDEAHTMARPRGDRGGGQHQRFDFLRQIANAPDRNIILVTATPHSGMEESFRSLLGLIDPSFDVTGGVNLPRRRLVPHLIQRRRADIESWLGSETPFPKRDASERAYNMSREYLGLFESVLNYCRESVSPERGLRLQQQRVRYWAAIAILRCVLSSPAAAEAMLERRAARRRDASQSDRIDADEVFAPQVLDSSDEDQPSDYAPTAPLDDPDAALTDAELRRLDGFLRAARNLKGTAHDAKLADAVTVVDQLLRDGHNPIVYCRYIATAEYVAEQLQAALARKHSGLRVVPVTGGDGGSEQRREKVDTLSDAPLRVLVATDCLSEGINLQEHFDAVVHFDLPWNPNRLEQREGRVDRYGQRRSVVRAVLMYGADNPVDLVVLDVLIRKARTIRNSLGIAVPVPIESEQVIQTVVNSVLLRGLNYGQQLQLALTDPDVSSLHAQMDRAVEREQQARAYFAQEGIKPDEVERELREMEPALGTPEDVRRFVGNALQRFGGDLREVNRNGVYELHPGDMSQRMAARGHGLKFPMRVAFDGVPQTGVTLLGRNHPVVATLSDSVLARALTDEADTFARCGAIYTNMVSLRTAVLVLRLRYLLQEKSAQQFAEEVVVAAFRRAGDGTEWLEPLEEVGLRLLQNAAVSVNMPPEERQRQVEWARGMLAGDWYAGLVGQRVEALEASHARLRSVIKATPLRVTPHTPPDILGCYVLVPSGGR